MEDKNAERIIIDYFDNAVNRESNNAEKRGVFVRLCALDAEKPETSAAKPRAANGKPALNYMGGAAQALLGLAASFLIVLFSGAAYSRPLAKQLGDELVTQRISSAFADLAKQFDEGIAVIIESNK